MNTIISNVAVPVTPHLCCRNLVARCTWCVPYNLQWDSALRISLRYLLYTVSFLNDCTRPSLTASRSAKGTDINDHRNCMKWSMQAVLKIPYWTEFLAVIYHIYLENKRPLNMCTVLSRLRRRYSFLSARSSTLCWRSSVKKGQCRSSERLSRVSHGGGTGSIPV
jgi:hypothetical protein